MVVDDDALSGLFAERYLIGGEIGRGATAIVYRAVDTTTQQTVALKVLRPEVAESLGADRFLREIRHHGRLDHPRVLRLLDSGDADGALFVVLPFMEGGTLRERMRRERQLPFGDVIRIAREVAEALGAAHAVGLVHRDVKPENILFSDGHAYLGDFGIARALEHATGERTTSTGVVRGTPTYMSPEQASGESQYDGRSDIYSLGCVIYEMVAGVPTFVGPTTQSVIAQRLTRPPNPVARFRDSTPAAIDDVIDKTLQMAPADRFQSAADLIAALDHAAEELTHPRGRTSAARRRIRRRYRWAAAAVVVVLAALGFARWLRPSGASSDPLPAGDPRRVAVLYFDALTPDALRPEVADGITEDLIDRLGSVRVLRVTSPNGVRPFRGSRVPVDSVARVLQAGTIVSGSVARSGDRLRVVVRLIDAATGRQIASQTLDEQWSELFGLQDRLADQVQYWLRRRLGEEIAVRTTRAGTTSVRAWELVQQASAAEERGTIAIRSDVSASTAYFARADSLYRAASQLDLGWAYPVVRRGELGMNSLALQSSRPPEGTDSARYHALAWNERRLAWTRFALRLANEVLASHAGDATALALRGAATLTLAESAGAGRDSMLAAAERDLNASLAARPDLAATWVAAADLSMRRGNFIAAVDAARRAVEADAFLESRQVVDVAFNSALFAEEFDEARAWCGMGRQRYPGDPTFAECELRVLGSAGTSARDIDQAWRLVREIEQRDTLQLLGQTWGFRRLMVAAILARSAHADSARHVLDLVERQQPDFARRASELAVAWVLTLLGDRAAAVERLDRLMRDKNPPHYPVDRLPWFKSLRGDPRFDSLTARRG